MKLTWKQYDYYGMPIWIIFLSWQLFPADTWRQTAAIGIFLWLAFERLREPWMAIAARMDELAELARPKPNPHFPPRDPRKHGGL